MVENNPLTFCFWLKLLAALQTELDYLLQLNRTRCSHMKLSNKQGVHDLYKGTSSEELFSETFQWKPHFPKTSGPRHTPGLDRKQNKIKLSFSLSKLCVLKTLNFKVWSQCSVDLFELFLVHSNLAFDQFPLPFAQLLVQFDGDLQFDVQLSVGEHDCPQNARPHEHRPEHLRNHRQFQVELSKFDFGHFQQGPVDEEETEASGDLKQRCPPSKQEREKAVNEDC